MWREAGLLLAAGLVLTGCGEDASRPVSGGASTEYAIREAAPEPAPPPPASRMRASADEITVSGSRVQRPDGATEAAQGPLLAYTYQTSLELPPGKHTLQLVVGDHNHVPLSPSVASERITITVE